MAEENIVIKITSEVDLSEANKQLDELLNKSKSLTDATANLAAGEKNAATATNSAARSNKDIAALLAENEKRHNEVVAALKAEVAVLKTSITALEAEIAALKKSSSETEKNDKKKKESGETNKRLAMRVRELREELMKMEMAGDTSSQAFIDMSVEAASLQDQMGDTQTQIRILASDTKNLDAAMSVGSGVAGAFNVATSAAALLGGESEELAAAFHKVQAAQAILNGVQQVANTLNKDSAARVVLRTAKTKIFISLQAKAAAAEAAHTAAVAANTGATKGFTTATKVATTAVKKFFLTLLANPIVAIAAAVVALGVGIYALTKALGEEEQAEKAAEKARENYNRASEKANIYLEQQSIIRDRAIAKIKEQESKDIAAAKKRGASEMEIAEIQIEAARKVANETAKYNGETQGDILNLINLKKTQIQKEEEHFKNTKIGTEAYTEAKKSLAESRLELEKLQKQYEDGDQSVADSLKALEDAKKVLEEKQKQLAKDITKEKIAAMKDGEAKEIAQIENQFEEQRKAYIEKYGTESALLVSLEKQKQAKLLEIQLKYAQQRQDLTLQAEMEIINQRIIANEYDLQAKKDSIAKQAQMDTIAQQRIIDNANSTKEQKALAAVKLVTIEQKRAKEVENAEKEHARRIEDIRNQSELTRLEAEATANENSLASRQAVLDQQEQMEIQAQQRIIADNLALATEGDATAIALKEQAESEITKIQADYTKQRTDLAKEGVDQRIEFEQKLVDFANQQNEKIVGDENQSIEKRKQALTNLHESRMAALQAQHERELAENQKLLDQKIISEEQFNERKLQMAEETENAKLELKQQFSEMEIAEAQRVLGEIGNIGNQIFSIAGDFIQNEMDKLNEYYTTDAEEAKKNGNKKLISEQEMEKRKAELKLKQAKLDKAQAIFNIGLNTANAITSALGLPFPMNIIMSGIVGTLAAIQLAAAIAKPLPQYAKGRKGGQGEFALVGEKGAELMYIPQGASIIPNHKLGNLSQKTFAEYGIPTAPKVPPLPDIDQRLIGTAFYNGKDTIFIDYAKIGKAVADNVKIPQQRNVSVNVDRSGVTVSDGHDTHTYLNKKYAGEW